MKLRSTTLSHFTIPLFGFIAMLCLSIIAPIQTFAQDTIGLQIQPTLIEERVEPGHEFSGNFKLTNKGADEEILHIGVDDIIGSSESGQPLFSDPSLSPSGFEMSSWVSVAQTELVIAAGESVDVRFTIHVPLNASPGSHTSAIFAERSAERLTTIGTGIGFRIPMIVMMQVAGDVVEDMRIREFATSKLLYGSTSVPFSVRLENLGNNVQRPEGFIEISNMTGKKTATISLNPSKSAVIPKSTRDFKIEWNDDEFHFGRYQAVSTMSFGEAGKQTVTSTLSFWILPLKFILPTVGILLFFVLVLYYSVNNYIRRRVKEMERMMKSSGRTVRDADRVMMRAKSAPVSRLMTVTIALLVFAVIFLLFLFFTLA